MTASTVCTAASDGADEFASRDVAMPVAAPSTLHVHGALALQMASAELTSKIQEKNGATENKEGHASGEKEEHHDVEHLIKVHR